MKVLDIAKTKVFSLDPDETVGKALSIMSENKNFTVKSRLSIAISI